MQAAGSRPEEHPPPSAVAAGFFDCARPRDAWRVTPERPTVLLGTLDTNGKEYAYLRERIRERGVLCSSSTPAFSGSPLTEPDVTCAGAGTA